MITWLFIQSDAGHSVSSSCAKLKQQWVTSLFGSVRG